MNRMTVSIVGAAAAMLVALGAGAGSASAAGQTGPYISGEGSCDVGRILAHPPQISASVQSYASAGTFVIGGSQWVAFKPYLARWDGTRWAKVAEASWRAKSVALQGDPAINSYYDYATGTWGAGGTRFPISRSGHYALYYELYWFGNEYVGAGSTTVWASAHRELRTNAYDLGAKPYCTY